MKLHVFAISAIIAACAFAAQDGEFFADEEWTPNFANIKASVLLPGSGVKMDPCVAASISFGHYISDVISVSDTLLYAPNACGAKDGNGPLFGASHAYLLHWWGFERLDPFFSCGLEAYAAEKHVFRDGSSRLAAGPFVGAGSFWHLTERASLRFEAKAALLPGDPPGMFYTVSAGLQYSW